MKTRLLPFVFLFPAVCMAGPGILVKYATPTELVSTNLAKGQIVMDEEDPSDLRIGDGSTPGGIMVGDSIWESVKALVALSIGDQSSSVLSTPELVNLIASARTSDPTPGLQFTKNSADEEAWWVSGYSGTSESVFVPAYKDGLPIAGIRASATGFDNVKSLVIGAECIEVNDIQYNDEDVYSKSAFTENTNLENVVWLNESARCSGDIENHFFRSTMTREERHGRFDTSTRGSPFFRLGAFAGCSNLQTFTAPWLKNIPAKCFQGDTALQSCGVPNVENVGTMAFRGSGLTSFSASMLKKAYNSAFRECGQLEHVHIGSLVEFGPECFRSCTELHDVRIPNVVGIGSKAFAGCSNIECESNLEFKNLKRIGAAAFGFRGQTDSDKAPAFQQAEVFTVNSAVSVMAIPPNTEKLYANSATEICKLPPTVTDVWVNSLEEIPRMWAAAGLYNIPGTNALVSVQALSAKRIGDHAFHGCKNLRHTRFPKVEWIGNGAFCGAFKLADELTVQATDIGKARGQIIEELRQALHVGQFKKLKHMENTVFADSDVGFSWNLQPVSTNSGIITFSATRVPGSIGNLFPNLETCGDGVFNNCQGISRLRLYKLKKAGPRLCGGYSEGDAKHTYRPSMNVREIILDNALTIGGSMGAGCESLQVFSAPKAVWMGENMIAGTPCHSSSGNPDYDGLSFPNLQRCSVGAFIDATNATSFSAPGLSHVSGGPEHAKTWANGAWTNIYVPSLSWYDDNLVEGSDDLETFTYGNYIRRTEMNTEDWEFTMSDGSTITKTVGVSSNENLFARLNQLEWQTSEYWCKWSSATMLSGQTNYVKTNDWPAGIVNVYVLDTGVSPCIIDIPRGWLPETSRKIRFLVPSIEGAETRQLTFRLCGDDISGVWNITSAGSRCMIELTYDSPTKIWHYNAQNLIGDLWPCFNGSGRTGFAFLPELDFAPTH